MAPDPHGATAEVESPAGEAEPPTAEVNGEVEPPSTGRMQAVYAPTRPSPAPAAEAPPRSRRVRRGRRVKRVIRRIELWSVLKLALVFYACMYIVVMAALVALWSFAYSTGLVDNFESFANDVGFEHWQFYGQHMFHQAAVIGAILVVAATIVTVLATALLNVISELTGGIRVVVIEEEVTYVTIDPEPGASGDDEEAAPRASAPRPEKGRARRR